VLCGARGAAVVFDQVLMQPVNVLSHQGKIGRANREGRSDVIVAARAVFLDAPVRLLVTVVHPGGAAHGEKDHEGV
jgi:hypothetical protein